MRQVSAEQNAIAQRALAAYAEFSKPYVMRNGWTVIPADAPRPLFEGVELTTRRINDFSTDAELYHLATEKPERFTAYVLDSGSITTWTGEDVAVVTWRGQWHRNNPAPRHHARCQRHRPRRETQQGALGTGRTYGAAQGRGLIATAAPSDRRRAVSNHTIQGLTSCSAKHLTYSQSSRWRYSSALSPFGPTFSHRSKTLNLERSKTMLINLNYLKAANVAASIEQTRYYLMGVSLTVVGSNVLYVATNGTTLIALRQDLDSRSECAWPANGAIIPSSLIAQIKQTPQSKRCGDVAEITFVDGAISIAVMGGATYSDKAIDGAFPAWRCVVPSIVNGETAQFDPALLASFAKARKALCNGQSKLITVGHNGNGPALVNFCDDANDGFGVIMPVRGDAPTATPGWASVSAALTLAPAAAAELETEKA